jgi:FkbM family methyltransferase
MLIQNFKKYKIRTHDIAVCEAVSDKVEKLEFHEFEQSEVSTLNTTILEEWKTRWNYKKSRKVVTKTLTQIFEEHSIPKEIDLLSIDVEGYDLNVLKSLDFEKYKPILILIEMHDFNIKDYQTHKIVEFLSDKGYDLIGFITMNGYFKLQVQ